MERDAPTQFICEELIPVPGTADTASMSHGEPGLPARFTWRRQEYRVRGVLQKWKSTSPCRNGSNEIYLRRHWFKVLTDPPAVMTLYFDRQAKNRRRPKARWFIYTVAETT